MNQYPFDNTNSENPWLIDIKQKECIIGPENVPLTAQYIWSKNRSEREGLLKFVFDYFREHGFPYPQSSEQCLIKSYKQLCNMDIGNIVDGDNIKNSNSNGTDILRHFCGRHFYATSSSNRPSPLDVFNNDDLFLKVLKNRMGWCTSKEDGTVRPYVFGITPDMIIQGIRSSGLGSTTSQFKPAVAKYIYSKYVSSGSNVFDYSCGWGARLLGAISNNLNYYGCDPLTCNELNSMLKFFNGNGKIVNGMSEEKSTYENIPMVDFIFSSPPYFTLEQYGFEDTQCNVKYVNYSDWLQGYWHETVSNCMTILNKGGKFAMVVVEKYKNYDLAKDMINVCFENGLCLVESINMKTAKSHLSSKKKTNANMKYTDTIYIFSRN